MNKIVSSAASLVPQDRLKLVKATVIGVGAIGRQVALQLAAIGVPEIQLVDFDVVDITNVTTQGYLASDVGLPKVEAAAMAIRRLDPAIVVQNVQDRYRPQIDIGPCYSAALTRSRPGKRSGDLPGRGAASGRTAGCWAKIIRVLAVSESDGRKYYPTTLFRQAEAHPGRCTARSTIYAANIAAGLMVHQFTRWLPRNRRGPRYLPESLGRRVERELRRVTIFVRGHCALPRSGPVSCRRGGSNLPPLDDHIASRSQGILPLATITRRLALRLKTVLRRAFGARGPGPGICWLKSADAIRIRAKSIDAAVEYRIPGDGAAADGDQGPLWFPFQLLADCEGKADEPVEIQPLADNRVAAQWRDRNVPQLLQYDAVLPPDPDSFPTLPTTFVENPSGLIDALREAGTTTDPSPGALCDRLHSVPRPRRRFDRHRRQATLDPVRFPVSLDRGNIVPWNKRFAHR